MPASPRAVLTLRGLLWLFYILWLLEGSLRKWILPQISDPLLLIRDPILLLIYGIAFANKIFPRGKLLTITAVLASVATFTSLLVIPEAPGVVAFGLRTDFLYLPLVFLMPVLWNRSHVEKLGRFTLVVGILMAPLIVAQFAASPDSPLNVGASGIIGGQINTARGHIRPAGTFSYVLGPSCLYALMASFLIAAPFDAKSKTPVWLVVVSAIALVGATVTSGSRTQFLSVAGVVCIGSIVSLLLRPGLVWRFLLVALLVVSAGAGASQLSFFEEGSATLSERFYGGSDTLGEGVQSGLIQRVAAGINTTGEQLYEVPLMGSGLGMGTIAAGKILTGRNVMLFAEDDWGRVIAESGPIVGVAFLCLRAGFLFALAARSWYAIKHQGNALPLLLLAAAAPPFLYGQWGQTTVLGFAVFGAGLSAAATVSASSAISYTRAYPLGETAVDLMLAKKGSEVRNET